MSTFKNRTTALLFSLLIISFISSCERFRSEDILLPRNDISLTIKGKEIMSFNPNTCQLGYNDHDNEFRVLNDRLSDWFIIRTDIMPAQAGQKITASLEYTTPDNTLLLNDLEFSVEKIDRSGMVWLWNDSRKIGAVIKIL